MKSTTVPSSANGATNFNGQTTNANGQNEPKVVPVADLIRKAKGEPVEDIKESTTYPAPAAPEAEPVIPEAEPVPDAVAPAPAAPASLPVPARPRQEEIAFQVEKSRQLQLINTQLTSLTSKRDELKQFSYKVDENHDSRYGRIVIYDDANREFNCRNHGVAALIVEELKKVFSAKIEEKENELLTVSRS